MGCDINIAACEVAVLVVREIKCVAAGGGNSVAAPDKQQCDGDNGNCIVGIGVGGNVTGCFIQRTLFTKCLTKPSEQRQMLARWPNSPIIDQNQRFSLWRDQRKQPMRKVAPWRAESLGYGRLTM